jgi:hypothetical protein
MEHLTKEAAWGPLEAVAERVVEDRSLPIVVPCEFMFMGYVERKRGPALFEYRHLDSEEYLVLTADLRVARYIEAVEGGPGRYVITRRRLHDVLSELALGEHTGAHEADDYCTFCAELIARRRRVRHLRAV